MDRRKVVGFVRVHCCIFGVWFQALRLASWCLGKCAIVRVVFDAAQFVVQLVDPPHHFGNFFLHFHVGHRQVFQLAARQSVFGGLRGKVAEAERPVLGGRDIGVVLGHGLDLDLAVVSLHAGVPDLQLGQIFDPHRFLQNIRPNEFIIWWFFEIKFSIA